jgi:hypothetical protein
LPSKNVKQKFYAVVDVTTWQFHPGLKPEYGFFTEEKNGKLFDIGCVTGRQVIAIFIGFSNE